MGIPRITQGCCEAILGASCRSSPTELGEEFCAFMEREQPELFGMMADVMCGMLEKEFEAHRDEMRIGVEAGRALLLVAFVWKAVTAQLEAQEMEEE